MGNRGSSMLQDEEIKLISEETGFSPAQIERLYSRFTSLDQSGICGSLSRQDFLRVPELAINPLRDRIVHMFFVDCDEDHDRINFRQFMKVLATFRSPSSSSRNISHHQRNPSLTKQGHLLFDTIDPSPFSPTLSKQSRHSSFHDSSNDSHHHHTTNQHSFRYAASSNHLPSLSNGHGHLHGQEFGHVDHRLTPVVDPDEPINSRRNKLYFIFKIYDVNNDGLIDFEDLVSVLKIMVGNYVDEPQVKKIAERSLRQADKNCDGFIDFEEFCSEFRPEDIDRLGSRF